MDDRKVVVVPEKKVKIRKIKEKYQNLQMSDATAEKISNLEVANNILKTSTYVAGIIAAIDWIIPDPVPGLDEVALTALVPLLNTASVIVENKIDQLAKTGKASLNSEEVKDFAAQLSKSMTTIKNERKPRIVSK